MAYTISIRNFAQAKGLPVYPLLQESKVSYWPLLEALSNFGRTVKYVQILTMTWHKTIHFRLLSGNAFIEWPSLAVSLWQPDHCSDEHQSVWSITSFGIFGCYQIEVENTWGKWTLKLTFYTPAIFFLFLKKHVLK